MEWILIISMLLALAALERYMRTDFDYFLEHSEFEELKEAYDKLHKKMWEYGWLGTPKEYL